MEGDRVNGLQIHCTASGRNGQATLTAKLAGEVIAVETLNLTKAKARAGFIDAVCGGRSGIDGTALETELLKLAATVASKPEAPPHTTTQPDSATLLTAMPEPVRADAHAMLDSPDLLQRVVDDIGLLGVAGEKELAATIYLVGVSRLLLQPLAAIVQGPSSSGKSYVIDKVATLFPPEAVIHATQMTPQALFHMKPGSLVHRFVVAGERSRLENDETAEATRALREMLSAGRLVKLMPMKVNGEIQTVSINQDGPIAYVESTTLSKLFQENQNRCVLVTTDEQDTQTRRIIATLAAGYAGGAAAGNAQGVIDRHHALQRMLRSYAVVVPFAERLGELIDHHRVEARRAFPHLIAMIQASALLHQHQRQIDAYGRLAAEADDYRLARHLLAVPMARQLGGRVSEPALRFLGRLRQWFSMTDTFTTKDAKGREKASKTAVYGWLGELHEAALLDKVEGQRGNRAARWRLSAEAPDPDAAAVLPPVENVCS